MMRNAVFVVAWLLWAVPAQADTFERDAATSATVAASVAEVTGLAISPLMVFSALGASAWIRHQGPASELPWHAQPWAWGPVAALLVLIFFKEALLGRFVLLKKPFDFAELLIDKAGALVLAPWVVTRALDALQGRTTEAVLEASRWVLPVAQASTGETTAGAWVGWLGLLVAAVVAIALFAVVWMASHAFNVLLLLSPFGVVDNAIRAARTGLLFLLGVLTAVDPILGAALALLLAVPAAFIAGWSFRLLVFGTVFSIEFLFGVRDERLRAPIVAFASSLPGRPARTLGYVARDGDELVFDYRPLLFLPRRRVVLPAETEVATGFISPALVTSDAQGQGRVLLRFPPRYRGLHEELAGALGGLPVGEPAMLVNVRSWVRSALAA